MHVDRTGLAALLFCLAGLAFNWPLVGLLLDNALFEAYVGVFCALAGLVLALALVARGGDATDPPHRDEAGREG